MLTLISLNNFKSYLGSSLPLAPLSIIIGANASGKSNALEAIRLLSWLAKGGRLDDIERNFLGNNLFIRGQGDDLFYSSNKSFKLSCSITNIINSWDLTIEIGLCGEQLVVISEEIKQNRLDKFPLSLYKIIGKPNPHTDEISVQYNNFLRGKNKPHIPCSNRQAIFYQLETPARFDKSHLKAQHEIPAACRAFRENLRNIVFLDPRPSLMHDYSYIKDDEMKEDGSNLSSVLYKICNDLKTINDKNPKDMLLDFIKSLPEQDIADIQFIETERKDVMVRLEETFGGIKRFIDAPLLSDGTLRVLAVAGALLSAPHGALVIVEEIDNGIHPSRANKLINNIIKVAKNRDLRVLITSHNPALLDALPDSSLGDVLCCYRNPEYGDSKILNLKALSRYPELVARDTLGQLMTKGVLDRFLKDKVDLNKQREAALDWVHSLKCAESLKK